MPSDAPTGPLSSIPTRVLLGIVLAATFVVYVGTLQFEFVYDDLGQIVANPVVHAWSYFPQYFRHNVWMQQSPIGNYYRPLFLTWLLVNHTIFGLQPFGWHLMTVLAHLAATALVFFLALRLTKTRTLAALAALLFGLNPVHLEAVAWISGGTEPLLAILLIGGFLAYLNYRERGRPLWLGLSLLLFALALLAKETAAILPILIAAYELLFAKEAWKLRMVVALRSVAPFAAIAIAYLLARTAALGAIAHRLVDLPGHIRLLTIPSVLWLYLKLLVVPARLSAFYDTPYVTHVSWKYFLAPLLAVTAALAICVIGWRKSRSPVVGFSLLWIFVPLLPVLDLAVLPMGDFVHDRYLYLPSVGFAVLLAMALGQLDAKQIAGRPAGVAVGLIIAGVMGVATIVQSLPWASDLLLYQHGMAVAPNNDLPRNKLAATYVNRGMFAEGIQLYHFVLANDPDYWYANYRMGYAQYMAGRFQDAERFLAKSISLHPIADEYYYLGMTRLKLGQLATAEAALREAVRLQPRAPGYSFALGLVLKQQGRLQPALDSFRTELALNPADPAAQAEIEELSRRIQN